MKWTAGEEELYHERAKADAPKEGILARWDGVVEEHPYCDDDLKQGQLAPGPAACAHKAVEENREKNEAPRKRGQGRREEERGRGDERRREEEQGREGEERREEEQGREGEERREEEQGGERGEDTTTGKGRGERGEDDRGPDPLSEM
eukprot:465943-Hanusia_phi.AAC.2